MIAAINTIALLISKAREDADAAAVARLRREARMQEHELVLLLDSISDATPDPKVCELIGDTLDHGLLADALLEA